MPRESEFQPQSAKPRGPSNNPLFYLRAVSRWAAAAALVGLWLLLGAVPSPAQDHQAHPPRIVQAVDERQRVTLKGNTHPLAVRENDRGVAPDSLPMQRMLLVLRRSAEQESALQTLLEAQQDKSSPQYHQWLTPEQFGQQFGPADEDVQGVTAWLQSHGFQVARIGAGRTVIEFSGTAGQVRETFGTEIHQFAVEDGNHWANASDPQIPAALAPVVVGVNTLHNFPKKRMIVQAGAFTHTMARGERLPFFTTSNGRFDLGPTDFATIYNLLPLWNAATPIDGTGQFIAIVGDSNINIQDIRDFRNLFGLPAKDPQIILDGPDPGINGDEGEADLDVEWAGAVAKNATIIFVAAADTLTSGGIDLAAFHVIDNNLAPVMSESFGSCEVFLGSAGNAFYSGIWEQAAAQGITVFVSAGDGGSSACDNFNTAAASTHGLGVSGIASTPFNVAVGGTDFDDAGNQSAFWNPAPNPLPTRASAKSYIPELTWNNTCAQNGLAGCTTPSGGIVAGSGGQSGCATGAPAASGVVGGTCAGYPKPSWQTGTGVPAANLRYLPDVSLFASNGHNLSAYVMCQADALPPTASPSCNPVPTGSFSFFGVGGTSVIGSRDGWHHGAGGSEERPAREREFRVLSAGRKGRGKL